MGDHWKGGIASLCIFFSIGCSFICCSKIPKKRNKKFGLQNNQPVKQGTKDFCCNTWTIKTQPSALQWSEQHGDFLRTPSSEHRRRREGRQWVLSRKPHQLIWAGVSRPRNQTWLTLTGWGKVQNFKAFYEHSSFIRAFLSWVGLPVNLFVKMQVDNRRLPDQDGDVQAWSAVGVQSVCHQRAQALHKPLSQWQVRSSLLNYGSCMLLLQIQKQWGEALLWQKWLHFDV